MPAGAKAFTTADHVERMLKGISACRCPFGPNRKRVVVTDEPARTSTKFELDCPACGGHEMVRLTYEDCAAIPGLDSTLTAILAHAELALSEGEHL